MPKKKWGCPCRQHNPKAMGGEFRACLHVRENPPSAFLHFPCKMVWYFLKVHYFYLHSALGIVARCMHREKPDPLYGGNAQNINITKKMVKYTDLLSLRNNPAAFANGLQNYVYQNCSNPQKVKVFDSVQGTFVYREVPCGKCWHCCQVKQADWVSRMFLHNEYWPHRYFITLTYTPLYDNKDFDSLALWNDFEETLPLWDSDNTSRTYGLHPCLLSRSHLRNYFKRLRKSLDIEISMFAVGEYGKKYSRPHYHLIVWSKEPIDMQLFKDAWSKMFIEIDGEIKPYRGQKGTPKRVYFGDVDVCDLNKPRFKSPHGNTTSDVFKYVAKYVNKYENYQKTQENDAKNTKNTICGVKSLRICKVFRNFAPEILKQRYYYEKKCISEFTSQYVQDLTNAPAPIVPFSRFQFVRTFAPFSVCSTKNAIGKDFILGNIESLAQGRFNPPSVDGVSFRFPAYYRRKIRDYQAPICICKDSFAQSSNGFAFSMGNYNYLTSLSQIINHPAPSSAACTKFDELLRKAACVSSRNADKRNYENVNVHLYDKSSKRHLIYDPLCNIFLQYKQKHGVLVRTQEDSVSAVSVAEKIRQGFAYLEKTHNDFITNYNRELSALQTIKRDVDNFNGLWLTAIQTLNRNLELHQQLYFAKRKQYTKDYD